MSEGKINTGLSQVHLLYFLSMRNKAKLLLTPHILTFALLRNYNTPAPDYILSALVFINPDGYSLINSGISMNS